MKSSGQRADHTPDPSPMSDVQPHGGPPTERYQTQPYVPHNSRNLQRHHIRTSNPYFAQNSDARATHNVGRLNRAELNHPHPSESHHFRSSGSSRGTGRHPNVSQRKPTQSDLPALALVGNPGAGKSTILNGFADEVVFRSGISYGSGLTTTLEQHCFDGITLYDTPGLADVDRKKQAGQELDKLLSRNVPLKIAFVVTLERGRVRPEDALTIKLVLDAIRHNTNNRFGVIINQVTERVRKGMEGSLESEAMVRSKLTGMYNTSHWCYVNMREDLEDENDKKLMTPDLKRFFWGLPETKPKGVSTVAIDTEAIEEKLETHMKLIKAIEEASAEERRRMTEEVKAQKLKYAQQESMLQRVEQELANVQRAQAEVSTTNQAMGTALKEAQVQLKRDIERHMLARYHQNQRSGRNKSGRNRSGAGPAVALAAIPALVAPTLGIGYKIMHDRMTGRSEPAEKDEANETEEEKLEEGIIDEQPYDQDLNIEEDLQDTSEVGSGFDFGDGWCLEGGAF